MIPLTVTTDLEAQPWADLPLSRLNQDGKMATVDRVGLLPGGMQSGKASVALWITLPDGQVVLAETSLALFRMAARALEASPIGQAELPL